MKKVVPPIIRFAEERTKRETLMYLLQLKFGPLPARVEEAVEAANSSKMKRLLDAFVTANSLADMPLFEG